MHTYVVGIDGSPESLDALRWAQAVAGESHRVRAVLAWRNARVFGSPLSVVPAYDEQGEAVSLSITHPDSPVEGPHIKGVATVGGVFYDDTKWDPEYHGTYFFAEAGTSFPNVGWINRAVFDEDHDLVEVDTFLPTGAVFPTTLVFSPDGRDLYYAHHLPGVAGGLRRITLDCNDNGVPDDDDIESGLSDDLNRNGVPDECDVVGDIDGDGVVGVGDLVLVILNWGPCGGSPCPGDVTGDGTVNVADLVFVILNWS